MDVSRHGSLVSKLFGAAQEFFSTEAGIVPSFDAGILAIDNSNLEETKFQNNTPIS